ncbi:uncharacterized protein A1O9_04706 [Exophiala aquamarina CBS 119918]|uniref:Uncharacterized protein n=1 Tax=Exophiala aquamarina CBS 119918 TaxID=1182545 RepID=A0A072PKK9_9EURO|nr:uncharacterized protein A1O9_04706 [Exophiala aquamarina CBS 119918]KEF59858.1 hypothetical protein A1O9_04706 [Exophiala aquamarina CBS 119918]
MSLLACLGDTISHNLRQLDEQLSPSHGDSPHLWDPTPYGRLDDTDRLPSQDAFRLIDKIRIDLKAVEALITPTHFRLVELGLLPYKVAALNTVVSLNVADTLTELGGVASLYDLALKLNTNEHKLGRIMRVLTGEFIFQEVSKGVFKHSRHSIGLTRSLGARSFMSFITDLGMRSALGIPSNVSQSETKDSFTERTAPFVGEVSKDGKTFLEYFSDPGNPEMVTLANDGIVGWLNKLTRRALLTDYPWWELGEATVIDVGCGPGDSGIDVMKKYPDLGWVFQDFEAVLENVKRAIPDELGSRERGGRILFVEQDYFKPNISKGDVWYLRGVLHEYDDDDVLRILSNLATAMRQTAGSRMIINEVFVASPVIAPASSTFAPSEHIPERQSALADMANAMTWSTFSLFGGKERSYQEYEKLLSQAGYRVRRFFRLRTFTVMLECELVQ